jgi:hypothetical protein
MTQITPHRIALEALGIVEGGHARNDLRRAAHRDAAQQADLDRAQILADEIPGLGLCNALEILAAIGQRMMEDR